MSMRTACALVLLCGAALAFPIRESRVGAETNGLLRQEHLFQKLEQRGWRIQSRAEPDQLLDLVIAVKLQNVDRLQRTLLDVSDPRSATYGQHLSQAAVQDLVKPSAESLAAVQRWLLSSGVSGAPATDSGDFYSARVTVREAEELLDAKYYVFLHEPTGRSVIRLNSTYTLPASVADHLDFVAPTVTFPPFHKSDRRQEIARTAARDDMVDPPMLQKLYNISRVSNDSRNNMAVASFLEQYYEPTDLKRFWEKYNLAENSFTNVPASTKSGQGIEAELDVQYISAMGSNVTTQVWYTPGNMPGSTSNEPWVTFLLNVANTTDAPHLFSISYGDDEDTVSLDYADRTCQEFMKAGARGISLLVASGDGGAGCSLTGFVPTFPATCPWITGVGGVTGGNPGSSPTDETVAGLSGGGFSNYWGVPDYQKEAQDKYIHSEGLPRQSYWNATGRGFPDVSAQAVDFSICVGGSFMPVSGTSAATPTTAGLFAMLNEVRLAAGKPTLGFLNPILYQIPAKDPRALNDITTGSNNYCGGSGGFPAMAGWDACSGLGSPNFGLLSLVVNDF